MLREQNRRTISSNLLLIPPSCLLPAFRALTLLSSKLASLKMTKSNRTSRFAKYADSNLATLASGVRERRIPRVPSSTCPVAVDFSALHHFKTDYPAVDRVVKPLILALSRIQECGLDCEPARAFSVLRTALAGVEFVDRRNIGTEETSSKKHARFWPAALLAALRARGVRVLLLRLIAGSDIRVCIGLEDPALVAPTGRRSRVFVYSVFFSPHSTDAASGANRAYVPSPEHLDSYLGASSATASV